MIKPPVKIMVSVDVLSTLLDAHEAYAAITKGASDLSALGSLLHRDTIAELRKAIDAARGVR